MEPRPYQYEAMEALHAHLMTNKGVNSLIVLPTGSGKSPLMAWIIQRYAKVVPGFRVLVLAHVKELVQQNADKMTSVWPEAEIGVYCAGLKRKETDFPITFASIQSMKDKLMDGTFKPFHMVIIDEAHRMPPEDDGIYRNLINDAIMLNIDTVILGLTATPYRMGSGSIIHERFVFKKIVYEAPVKKLIEQGYLSPLISKVGDTQPDLTGVSKARGEFVTSDLTDITNKEEIVSAAINEALLMVDGRKHIVVFCVDIEHCEMVMAQLEAHGEKASFIHSKITDVERDKRIKDFREGRIRWLLNVGVLVEGFDSPFIDVVMVLRPTASKGLFAQIVGRGLRIAEGKKDCLILDFGRNIERLGAVDDVGNLETKLHRCECKCVFPKALRVCPMCKLEVPKEEAPTKTCTECGVANPISADYCVDCGAQFIPPERKMHDREASEHDVLSVDMDPMTVDEVTLNRNIGKDGKLDTLKVTYICGSVLVSEWVCIEHEGYARSKAVQWWMRRFTSGSPPDNLSQIFKPGIAQQLQVHLSKITKSIQCIRDGKWLTVDKVYLETEQRESYVQ